MLLLDEIFNRNLAIDQQYLLVALGALTNLGKIDFSMLEMNGEIFEPAQLVGMAAGFSRETVRPYHIQNGAAVIPVHGSLTHRFGSLRPSSGMTGYDGIRANIQMAQDDPQVKGIIYDINSPGGSVDGLFDLTDWAKEFVTKPTRAIVDPQACSAAQMFASVADLVTLSRTDRMGSIGAVSAHTDVSEMMKGRGQKITLIAAGSRKVEGNPYEALSEEVYNSRKASLEDLRTMFVQTLVDNRGCDFNALMATEAAVLNAKQAVELKLADKIMSPADSLAEFIDQINPTNGVIPMLKPDTNASVTESQSPQLDESAIRAEATTAERARIKGIIMSAQSEGRVAMAHHIAFNTSMSAAEGEALLGVSPKMSATLETTTEQTTTTDFAKVMGSFDPNVPSDDNDLDASADTDGKKKSRNPLIAAHSQMHA
ncbi:S49 family peptidase [Marinomonas shanghaiensis]|uniref:S49 family peptidase n=1 Tax=Marinomonas shanghaiensis TaxID=2202418 RepID=UPI000DB910AF|nr:S49 family peptidase [Marinomonas shanghaiensis]